MDIWSFSAYQMSITSKFRSYKITSEKFTLLFLRLLVCSFAFSMQKRMQNYKTHLPTIILSFTPQKNHLMSNYHQKVILYFLRRFPQ